MIEPYYQDEAVTLYHGDCRDVVASLPLIIQRITKPIEVTLL